MPNGTLRPVYALMVATAKAAQRQPSGASQQRQKVEKMVAAERLFLDGRRASIQNRISEWRKNFVPAPSWMYCAIPGIKSLLQGDANDALDEGLRGVAEAKSRRELCSLLAACKASFEVGIQYSSRATETKARQAIAILEEESVALKASEQPCTIPQAPETAESRALAGIVQGVWQDVARWRATFRPKVAAIVASISSGWDEQINSLVDEQVREFLAKISHATSWEALRFYLSRMQARVERYALFLDGPSSQEFLKLKSMLAEKLAAIDRAAAAQQK